VTFADESRTRSADEAPRQREDKKRPQVNHKQLELDFGDKIDAMTSEDRLQLLTSHPNYATVAAVARQLGPDSKLVRPLLLEAFAATYQQN
jgi:2-oxo-4-hydroxy-4-carboxy--5-ureidoimidazoline (OHCU) decarboxylase